MRKEHLRPGCAIYNLIRVQHALSRSLSRSNCFKNTGIIDPRAMEAEQILPEPRVPHWKKLCKTFVCEPGFSVNRSAKPYADG